MMKAYGAVVTHRLRAMGIRDKPIAPGSPWQNGYAERLIGTVRRECLDRMLIFGESHLRRILSAYAAYYNQMRTHLALQKDAPLHRAAQHSGVLVAIPNLGRTASPVRADMIFGKDRFATWTTGICAKLAL
jgi:transposase InsO family protein